MRPAVTIAISLAALLPAAAADASPRQDLAALRELRGSAHTFVLHLYDDFRGRADADAVPSWLASQISEYTAAGFHVELVLRYRPDDPRGDVPGYLHFVRSRVRQLGPDPLVTSLQITNEANVAGAPAAADGAYRGARLALVRGVVAAKDETRRGGFEHLRIGFNWADEGARSARSFWRSLRRQADPRFQRSVDWVGLDSYPGTWGPWSPGRTLASGARRTTLDALRRLRRHYLPLARIGHARLHVSESGYPTGPGRTIAMQASVLRSVVQAITDLRRRYRVTDYRWFDLRDADSASRSFESQYGLMRDDYRPKPAFGAYRDIIARLG